MTEYLSGIHKDLNKEDWNRFILEYGGSFLQSFEWGEFQESVGKAELSSGRRVFRFFGEKSTRSEAEGSNWQAQFIEYPLPMGKKYWHAPKGPVFSLRQDQAIKKDYSLSEAQRVEGFVRNISEEAQKNGIMFFRVGLEWPAELELSAKLEIAGFKKLRYEIEPCQTLILDITQSEPKLLAQMHSKWRYNINLARKKGVRVKITEANDADFNKYFESFWRLMHQTARRQKIRLHDKEYYKKQLMADSEQFKNLLFIAEHQGQVVAANIVNFFGHRATYLHGGSDNGLRHLMAPHLLQWRQISAAKKLGCREYDFWGISEKRWPGVTRFKRGFGGREVTYTGCWDYPLDKKWYLLYKGAQRFRR